jgi:peptidoglycan hydrolase CwlO-like protein
LGLEKIKEFIKEHRKAFIGMVCIAIVIFGVLAWTNNEFSNLRTSIQTQELQIQQLNSTVQQLNSKLQQLDSRVQKLNSTVQQLSQIQSLNSTVQQLQTQIQGLLQQNETIVEGLLDDISRLEKEIEKQNKTIWQLQEKLEKIENTTWENVNNYVKNKKPGWDAKTMAQDLTSRFWVETKIVTQDGVQYLFLHFRCNCPTEWWWVTYQGLKPASEAPVQP